MGTSSSRYFLIVLSVMALLLAGCDPSHQAAVDAAANSQAMAPALPVVAPQEVKPTILKVDPDGRKRGADPREMTGDELEACHG